MAEIEVKVREQCENCKGSGYEEPPRGQSALGGKPGLTCKVCGGSGPPEGSWMSMAEFRKKFIDGK
jgi:DnaJ-class molecular chaperone